MPNQTNKTQTVKGMPGVKALLATASLAATIGGWAWMTANAAQPINSAQVEVAQAVTLNLQPLPTLVPEPTQASGVASPVTPATSVQTTVNPAPQPQFVLPSISLPTLPTFRTRTSR
jgi:hypothetical protein